MNVNKLQNPWDLCVQCSCCIRYELDRHFPLLWPISQLAMFYDTGGYSNHPFLANDHHTQVLRHV